MATTAIASAHARSSPASSVSAAGLIRISGLATILAGVLIAFFPLLHPNHDPAGFASTIWVPVHLMPAISMVLGLFGLVGLLTRQLERAGRLGVIGFAVAFVGNALILTGTDVEAFIMPFIGLNTPQVMQGHPPIGWLLAGELSGLIFAVGYILLGISVVRAGALSRGAGLLLAVGGPLLGIGAAASGMLPPVLLLGALLFGLALVWVGYELWSDPAQGTGRLAVDARHGV